MLRIFALVLGILAAAPAVASTAKPTLVVDVPHSSYLNLRAGPGTHYHVIGTMPDGAHVKFLERSGDWAKVYYDHKIGWAYGDYLDRKNAKKDKKAALRERIYIVHAPYDHYLNLRHGPGTQYHVIAQMPHKTPLVVVGPRQGSWVKVRHLGTGHTGWAHSGYMKKR